MVGSSVSVVQAANEYFDALVKSRFIEMFGSNEKVTLTELASITMGQSPNSSSYNDEGRGVPFFQGKTEFGDTFVSVNLYCDAPKKMAKSMDILMSVRAPVGSVNITPVDCCIGRGLAAISPISNVTNVWFLFHALKLMEKEIESMGVGSTFKAINKSNINEIKVPLAPIELQNQFADFVRQVDKSKLLFQQMVSKYDELVKSRFIEMFENNPKADEWSQTDLNSICNGITDGSHNPPVSGESSNNLMLSSKNIHDDIIDFDEPRYLTDLQFQQENKRTNVQKDDLLMTIVGTIGRTAIVPDLPYNITFQRSVSVIHPKRDLVNAVYLKACIDKMQPKLEQMAHGSSQKGIYLNQVKSISITVPPMEIQNQFADFVRQVDKSKSEILEGIKRLKSNRITDNEPNSGS